MAVLEIGINYDLKTLVERKYYKYADNVLDQKTRSRFITGVQSYLSEVYDDTMNVISFANLQIVCYCKSILIVEKESFEPKILMLFAIIEKGTNPDFITKHLKKIYSKFLKKYTLRDILIKEQEFFTPFEKEIDKILGDLRFKVEDRLDSLFK